MHFSLFRNKNSINHVRQAYHRSLIFVDLTQSPLYNDSSLQTHAHPQAKRILSLSLSGDHWRSSEKGEKKEIS